jgi:hypothetical protein
MNARWFHRRFAQRGVNALGDDVAFVEVDRLGDYLAVLDACVSVHEAPTRTEVQLDPLLTVPLAKVKGATVHHAFPLLRRVRTCTPSLHR